jgi:hypothetical protein
VVLGGRGSLARCLVVWMSGTVVLAAAGRGLGPPVTACWVHRRSLDALPLDQALTRLAAVVLLVGAVWGWLGLTSTVIEAMSARSRGKGPEMRLISRNMRRSFEASAAGLGIDRRGRIERRTTRPA